MVGGSSSLLHAPGHPELSFSYSMFFKPLSDQNGIQTPSWASRLWFLIVMFGTASYVWLQVSQNLAIWSLCTLVVSTVLLNLGWVVSARISHGKQPSVLFDSINQDKLSEQE
mgnify:CR=1 FL=1